MTWSGGRALVNRGNCDSVSPLFVKEGNFLRGMIDSGFGQNSFSYLCGTGPRSAQSYFVPEHSGIARLARRFHRDSYIVSLFPTFFKASSVASPRL